VFLS
jgi:hypothetical protein